MKEEEKEVVLVINITSITRRVKILEEIDARQ